MKQMSAAVVHRWKRKTKMAVVVLLVTSALLDSWVHAELISTSYSCLSEASFCQYQHAIECPGGSRIDLVDETQQFPLSPGECRRQVQQQECEGDCCQPPVGPNCTASLATDALTRLRQQCNDRQRCSPQVTRQVVVCPVLGTEGLRSFRSTLHYRCLQSATGRSEDTTAREDTTALRKATGGVENAVTTPVMPPTVNLTTTSGISAENVSSPGQVPTDPLSAGAGGEEGQAQGVRLLSVAGRIAGWLLVLLGGCGLLLLAWCKRRARASSATSPPKQTATLPAAAIPTIPTDSVKAVNRDAASSHADDETTAHADVREDITSYDALGDKRTTPTTDGSSPLYDHVEGSADCEDSGYSDDTMKAGRVNVVDNVYLNTHFSASDNGAYYNMATVGHEEV